MIKTPLDILKQFWDHHSFRPLQEDIIHNVLKQKDTFVLLPTGGGKSICYQIPAILQEGLCLVISPLIALMKDQVQNLNSKGIKAIALDSTLNREDIDRELNNCLYGSYKFLYLSPERLQSPLILERIRRLNINLIAVDEAHCISQWGNDFRPAYAHIQQVRIILPDTPIIALTGSAKPIVVKDIIENLNLKEPVVFKSSFKRSNLAYMTFDTENKYEKLQQILKKNSQSSIVYVRNRKKTKQICDYLNENGFSASFYHGGMTNVEKEKHYKLWIKNDVQVMVATNAFGMGIDKPDVKTVIHLGLTDNLENYYQEAGRAGRNGHKAFAIILKNQHDLETLKNQFSKTLPEVKDLKYCYRKLCSYLEIAYQEGEHTKHDFNLYSFCNTYQLNIPKTFNALTFLDRQGIIRFSKEFKHQTSLQFLVDNYNLIYYIKNHKHHNTLINFILRTYGGAFESNITVDLNFIATHIQLSKEEIKKQLLNLKDQGIINLKIFDSDSTITFLEPREDDKTINRIAKYLKQQNSLKKEQVKAVINYINDNTTCKEKLLLNYFGEENEHQCGQCSNCIAEKITAKESIHDLQDRIINALKKQPLNSKELLNSLNCSEEPLLQTLRALADVSKIRITPDNKYQLES